MRSREKRGRDWKELWGGEGQQSWGITPAASGRKLLTKCSLHNHSSNHSQLPHYLNFKNTYTELKKRDTRPQSCINFPALKPPSSKTRTKLKGSWQPTRLSGQRQWNPVRKRVGQEPRGQRTRRLGLVDALLGCPRQRRGGRRELPR